jgi:hypothetical protein
MKASDDQEAGLSSCAGWYFQEGWIVAEGLGSEEVDAVLLEVGGAFGRIEGKHHGS